MNAVASKPVAVLEYHQREMFYIQKRDGKRRSHKSAAFYILGPDGSKTTELMNRNECIAYCNKRGWAISQDIHDPSIQETQNS